MHALIEADNRILALLNGSESVFLDNLVITLTSGLTWIPLYLSLLYVIIKNNETMKQIMLILGCIILCIFLSDGITDFIVKPLVARQRPSYDPLMKYSIDVVNDVRATGYSFFSAHAANTFGIALFFSLLIRNKTFIVSIVFWSLVNCWTRLYLGVHYPSDIIVGLIWGTIAGLVAYYIYIRVYLRMHPAFNYISSQYSSTGYSHADIDVVLLVLVLTFLFSIIGALIF